MSGSSHHKSWRAEKFVMRIWSQVRPCEATIQPHTTVNVTCLMLNFSIISDLTKWRVNTRKIPPKTREIYVRLNYLNIIKNNIQIQFLLCESHRQSPPKRSNQKSWKNRGIFSFARILSQVTFFGWVKVVFWFLDASPHFRPLKFFEQRTFLSAKKDFLSLKFGWV